MKLVAVLIDSWQQARDRRALLILSILSGLVILFCAGLSFTERAPATVLDQQTKNLGRFSFTSERQKTWREAGVAFDASSARSEPGGALAITVTFRTAREVDRFVREWRDFRQDVATHSGRRRAGENLSASSPSDTTFSADSRKRALEERFADAGYSEVKATPLDSEATSFDVQVVPRYPHEVRGGVKLGFMFGAWEIPLQDLSKAEVVVQVESVIANSICGTIGMLIALLVCAGFIPDFLQKGTLDLVLARPIGRTTLLLGKFLGGLWFTTVFTAIVVAGSWAALGLRTGYWSPHFLLTIFTMVAQFAVIYSIATLVGLWSRSAGLSALIAVGVWMIAGAVATARQLSKGFGMFKMPEWLDRGLETIYTILPKTSDLSAMNTVFLAKAWLSPEARARVMLSDPPHIDYAFSFGTTAAFTVAMLALACWLFRRRDW